MSNTRVKGSNQKRSQPNAQLSSESLDLQMTRFLDSGGVIDQIPQGVSGQVFTPMTKK